MLIKSIDLKNNEIFGDIHFDFCDSNGIPYQTVIFAGENGSGKSAVLNIIYSFCETMYSLKSSNEIREFTLFLTDEEQEMIIKNDLSLNGRLINGLENEIKLIIDFSVPNNWNSIRILVTERSSQQIIEIGGYLLSSDPVRNIFKGIFSDVEVNYTPNIIQNTSSLEIDTVLRPGVKSSNNLATEITQLLIDIESLDNSDFANWARENPEEKTSAGISDKRMIRFKNAFDLMFSNKRFKRVSNTEEGKRVLFEEYGKEISINNLSSGEKQIVFRGSFLLKDKLSTQGAIALIDEPEISLHPNWQLNILEFYKKLFTDESNTQTSQIFVATHSPFVIHNNNREKDKIVILNKNEEGIYIERNPSFFGWTPEQAITQAFDIKLNFEKNKLIVLVEGLTDEKYINTALKLFSNFNENIIVQWVGRKDNVGDKFTGETALDHTRQYLLSNNNLHDNTFVLLYDSDTKAKEEDIVDKNLYIRRVPINTENNLYEIGIENLLTLPLNFDVNSFYSCKKTKDRYGAKKIVQNLEKNKLCNWICEEISVEEQKLYLNKFQLIISAINNVFEKHKA